MSSWVLLAVILTLAGALVAQQWLHNRQTTVWMRAFSEKQGISQNILAGIEAPAAHTPLKGDTRKRIRIPVVGMPWQK
jgi:hypothetical protein